MLSRASLIEKGVEVAATQPGGGKSGVEDGREEKRQQAGKQAIDIGVAASLEKEPLLNIRSRPIERRSGACAARHAENPLRSADLFRAVIAGIPGGDDRQPKRTRVRSNLNWQRLRRRCPNWKPASRFSTASQSFSLNPSPHRRAEEGFAKEHRSGIVLSIKGLFCHADKHDALNKRNDGGNKSKAEKKVEHAEPNISKIEVMRS